MTLEEAKNRIAQKYGHESWEIYTNHEFDWFGKHVTEEVWDEVAHLYAFSKWNEACRYYIKNTYDTVMPTKPEFKP